MWPTVEFLTHSDLQNPFSAAAFHKSTEILVLPQPAANSQFKALAYSPMLPLEGHPINPVSAETLHQALLSNAFQIYYLQMCSNLNTTT
jgi:hypothetical protein